MSANINKLQEQIPLYINGTIKHEERTQFEQALKQYPELKQEYKEFREIESVIDVLDKIPDAHFGKLYARIQANAKFEPPTKPATSIEDQATVIMRRDDGVDKSAKANTDTRAKTTTDTPPLTSEARDNADHKDSHHDEEEHVAIFSKEYLSEFFTSARLAWGVVIAQFVLLISLWLSPTGNGITTIGADGRPINDIATINVVFADSATQKEIRELLAGVEAQIANGPTSIGLYTIYIKGNENDAKSVIDRLKKSALILLAEPAFI